MASWILNRPAELANLAELQVAEFLSVLPDDWAIRWGFYYKDNAGVQREGDFLVLGPDGALMVLEVKGGSLDQFPTTGRWDTASRDSPIYQLDAEWKAVVRTINDQQGERPLLFVTRALGLPQLDVATDIQCYHDVPRALILSRAELRNFASTWAERLRDSGQTLDPQAREIFFETYGKGATPEVISHFADQTDRALLRHTEGNYELLDILQENRQFLVKGGPGSGKTWLAFEQACRWAEHGDASKVLFLCYNLALTDFIREMARKSKLRGRPRRGAIEVMSWEEVARGLLRKAGLPYEVPTDDNERNEFFDHTLPELMVQVTHENLCCPGYDALVVDEAQDHDTGMASFPPGWQGPGWWGVYWRLLRDGPAGRVAIFYDPAQRPVFRNAGVFCATPLYQALKANPVQVQLQKSVRYTWPVLNFLKGLRTSALAPLVDALRQRGSLPQGPNVEEQTVTRDETRGAVAAIIERWIRQGHCRPDEILVLSQHGRKEKWALGETNIIGGRFLVDFLQRQQQCISRTSVNKAKGLDSRAVILVDFEPFEQLADAAQIGYFMGASGARQLLAIVHNPLGDHPS
jgi:hypothetical protein